MSCRIFYDYGDRRDVGHEGRRDEGWRKGLLALAVVGGFRYWGKVNPSGGISSRTPQIPSGPAIATRFSENSNGVVVYRQPDGAQELVLPKKEEFTTRSSRWLPASRGRG